MEETVKRGAQKRDALLVGRKRPYGYTFNYEYGPAPLYVPGHYETACGGCDTIKTVNEVYTLVRGYSVTHNVLYEGIMVMDDVRRAVELSKEDPSNFLVIGLTTPLEDCIKAIEERRRARGVLVTLDPANTINRDLRFKRGLARLTDAGVKVEKLDREAAFERLKGLLCT